MRRLVGVVGSGAGASAAESKDALLRATRKAASAARSAAWPNTLEGLRRRKVEERAARDVASEAAAVELDREAADARLMERLAVLRAANAYFEGQSDKVKALRNFRQRVADKESDTAATTLRKRREAALKGDEADFVAFQTAQKNAGDAIEAAKTASARVRAGEIAAGLTLQVRGVIQRRADDNAAEDARALLVKADSERLAGEERAALARKAAIIAAGKLKFAADNAMERAARANAADEGAALTIVVAAQVAQQEAQKALVKGILARQKAEREAHADIITGIMAKDYMSRQNHENERVEKEIAITEAKVATAMAKKKAEQADLARSIKDHLQMTRKHAVDEARTARDEGARDHGIFRTKIEALAAQETRDAKARRTRATDNQFAHKAMMADKKRTLISWDAVDTSDALLANAAAQTGGPLDAVFHDEMHQLRDEMIAKEGVRGAMAVDRLVHKLTHIGFS